MRKLAALRPGIPQFLFADGISGVSSYLVRSNVLAYKHDNPEVKEIDFIINSPGGSPADAYRIIRTLRKNFETVNIIVPYWAKSAATLLALGGNSIIMDEYGELGPLDTQVGKEREDSPKFDRESALNDEYSVRKVEEMFQVLYQSMFFALYEHDKFHIHKVELSKQLLKGVSKFYAPLMSQINPYKLGEKSRTLEIGDKYAKRILHLFHKGDLNEEQIRKLTNYLVNECPDHSYVIDYDNIAPYFPQGKIVKQALAFGEEYATTLSQLSSILVVQPMLDANFSYVDFIALEGQQEDEADEEASDSEPNEGVEPTEDGEEQKDKLLFQAVAAMKRTSKTTSSNGQKK